MDNLKTGNWKEALKVAYTFLQAVFWWSIDKDGKSTFWFSDNNKEIQDIVNNVAQDPIQEQQAIIKLQSHIEREWWTKKKLWLCYAMSQIMNRLNQRDSTIKNLVDSKTEQQDKHIALMSQSVEPWDIIAINKSEKTAWDSLLTELHKWDIDASHVMMITKVDKQKGTVTFIHSTINKLSQPWQKWVEQEIDFSTYAKQFNGLAVAVLKPPVSDSNKQEYINNVIQKDGKPYDSLSAMSQALVKNNMYSNNNKYNCVELIAESFIPPKKRTHPADMIKECTPKYVTIAGKSIWWS